MNSLKCYCHWCNCIEIAIKWNQESNKMKGIQSFKFFQILNTIESIQLNHNCYHHNDIVSMITLSVIK